MDESISIEERRRCYEALRDETRRAAYRMDASDADRGRWLDVKGGNRLDDIMEWHYLGWLSPDRLRDLLAEWWSMGEGHSGRGRTRLGRLFQAAGFVTEYRHLGPGIVLAAEVPPRHVLGIFHGRQEAEVIVTPRGLRNLREVRRITNPSPEGVPGS